MSFWQHLIVIIFAIVNIIIFIKAFYEIKNKNNVFGSAQPYGFLGIFVWGDAIVICVYWLIASLIVLFLNNWYLFLLFISVFWVVRSYGEVIYWLNEQFAGKNRNPPHTLKLYNFFKNDSIWFVYQVFWQCILVFSLIISIFLASKCLHTLSVFLPTF